MTAMNRSRGLEYAESIFAKSVEYEITVCQVDNLSEIGSQFESWFDQTVPYLLTPIWFIRIIERYWCCRFSYWGTFAKMSLFGPGEK
jgi:hypothetical protein